MVTIAVVAHKGGAGKTTVAINLGAAIAAGGRRVLLVDCDPQGSLAAALAVPAGKPCLYEVLDGRAGASDAVRSTAVDGLDVLPADIDLAGTEAELSGRSGWYRLLRDALAPLDSYDVILLDTPPGLGALSFMTLQAAGRALALCPTEFLAHRALAQVLATIDRARQLSPSLALLGILPTMVTRGSRHQRDVLDRLRAEHGDLVLHEVPRRVALQDAAAAGLPVNRYAPRSDSTVVFQALALDVLARAGMAESSATQPEPPGGEAPATVPLGTPR
jgi:chromosome partitioning protein